MSVRRLPVRGSFHVRLSDDRQVQAVFVSDREVQIYRPDTKRSWWISHKQFFRLHDPASPTPVSPKER